MATNVKKVTSGQMSFRTVAWSLRMLHEPENMLEGMVVNVLASD